MATAQVSADIHNVKKENDESESNQSGEDEESIGGPPPITRDYSAYDAIFEAQMKERLETKTLAEASVLDEDDKAELADLETKYHQLDKEKLRRFDFLMYVHRLEVDAKLAEQARAAHEAHSQALDRESKLQKELEQYKTMLDDTRLNRDELTDQLNLTQRASELENSRLKEELDNQKNKTGTTFREMLEERRKNKAAKKKKKSKKIKKEAVEEDDEDEAALQHQASILANLRDVAGGGVPDSDFREIVDGSSDDDNMSVKSTTSSANYTKEEKHFGVMLPPIVEEKKPDHSGTFVTELKNALDGVFALTDPTISNDKRESLRRQYISGDLLGNVVTAYQKDVGASLQNMPSDIAKKQNELEKSQSQKLKGIAPPKLGKAEEPSWKGESIIAVRLKFMEYNSKQERTHTMKEVLKEHSYLCNRTGANLDLQYRLLKRFTRKRGEFYQAVHAAHEEELTMTELYTLLLERFDERIDTYSIKKQRDVLTSTLNTSSAISDILSSIIKSCQDEHADKEKGDEKTTFITISAMEAIRTYLFNFYKPEAVHKIFNKHRAAMEFDKIGVNKTIYLTRLQNAISDALRYVQPRHQTALPHHMYNKPEKAAKNLQKSDFDKQKEYVQRLKMPVNAIYAQGQTEPQVMDVPSDVETNAGDMDSGMTTQFPVNPPPEDSDDNEVHESTFPEQVVSNVFYHQGNTGKNANKAIAPNQAKKASPCHMCGSLKHWANACDLFPGQKPDLKKMCDYCRWNHPEWLKEGPCPVVLAREKQNLGK